MIGKNMPMLRDAASHYQDQQRRRGCQWMLKIGKLVVKNKITKKLKVHNEKFQLLTKISQIRLCVTLIKIVKKTNAKQTERQENLIKFIFQSSQYRQKNCAYTLLINILTALSSGSKVLNPHYLIYKLSFSNIHRFFTISILCMMSMVNLELGMTSLHLKNQQMRLTFDPLQLAVGLATNQQGLDQCWVR